MGTRSKTHGPTLGPDRVGSGIPQPGEWPAASIREWPSAQEPGHHYAMGHNPRTCPTCNGLRFDEWNPLPNLVGRGFHSSVAGRVIGCQTVTHIVPLAKADPWFARWYAAWQRDFADLA